MDGSGLDWGRSGKEKWMKETIEMSQGEGEDRLQWGAGLEPHVALREWFFMKTCMWTLTGVFCCDKAGI